MYYHVALMTLTLCGRMIIASTNYHIGRLGLGVILGRPVAQKNEWEKVKKPKVRFCEVFHGRSELPVRPC